MKKGKMRLLAGMIGAILVATEIMSMGIPVSATELLSEPVSVAESEEKDTGEDISETLVLEDSKEGDDLQEENSSIEDATESVSGDENFSEETKSENLSDENLIENGEEETENLEMDQEETIDKIEGNKDEEISDTEKILYEDAASRLETMTSVDDIASGTSNNIAWVIDANGKLTVEGTGDFKEESSPEYNRAPWSSYGESVKTVKINVSGMTDASYMFYRCNNITNIDFSSFSTDTITNMENMFACDKLTYLDLSNFNTSNVTNMAGMFSSCSSLKSLDLSNFDTSKVTDMSCMFWRCKSLESLDLSNFNTRKVNKMIAMFSECNHLLGLDISSFNTGNVENMRGMFENCNNLMCLNLSNFNTSKVTDMSGMFSDCSSLKSLNVSNFDTSNVIYMGCWLVDSGTVETIPYGMFYGCSSLSSLDLSSFDTGSVTNMWGMFYGCSSLSSLDLSSFDTGNVKDMGNMFRDCSSLSSLDVSGFDTGSVTGMWSMFSGCSSLSSLDVSGFDTGSVAGMGSMFRDCSSLSSLDLSSFDTGNVTNMDYMLSGCSNLRTIYTPYNIKISVPLPAQSNDTWYCSDGTAVTELPPNLSYSVALGKNHIPDEKNSSAGQLTNSGNSIFLFRDAMTGIPIKAGRVCIEEKFTGTHYYYPSKDNGYVRFPLSKNCKEVFISTYFDGYESFGGWADLSYYQSESGIYIFDINPKQSKYVCPLPSMKTSVTTSAPDVGTKDESISLLNIDMDFDIDFGKGVKSTVTYDKEDKTIKVAISTEGKASYDEIEEKFKASESKSVDAEFEGAEDKMKPGEICNLDVKVAVKGYLKFTETGEFMEGGAIVNVKGSGSVEYRPVSAAGLVYAKYELGVSAEGKLIFTYVGGNLDTSATVKIEPYIKLAVGAGWSLAHAEIGAVGKMPIEFDFPWKDAQNSLSIDAVVELYGEVKFLYFGGKYTAKMEENIWPKIWASDCAALNTVDVVTDELEILPRNYLSSENQNRNFAYSAQNQSFLTPSDSFRYSDISKDYGVFEENNVQYAKLSNGTEILAWIHDFGDKSSANRTTLVYSVNKNDGNGWSNITPVCNDTATGDYYPNMTAEGNKAYLVWNKASKEFDDNTGIDVVSSHMDVYVSVFENGVFSKPQMVSDADNGLIEFSPIAAVNGNSAAVAWLTNSENDYHYTKGSNAIYVCEYSSGSWKSPVCYAQDLNYVSDYDMDYVNGSVAVLYAEDADNVSATQDGTVYYVRNGVKTMVGDASYHAEIVDLCDGKLYFSGGSKVYKASADKLSYIYDTGIATDNFSVVKNASSGEVILFLQQDGFANNVCAAYLREGVYTAPVPVISDNSRITNYSPIYNEDGTISIAYDEEEVLEASDAIYGLTDMVVKRKVEPALFFVDADLAYNAYDVAPGNTIEFAALVSNYTTHAVSKVKATLSGNSFGEIYEGVLEVDIPMGEQQYVSLSYTLPDTIVNQQYTLTVTPVDFEDTDLSDNSAVCELGFSDIAVSDLKLENNKITGRVKNVGCQTAENVSLTIKEDNQENSPIAVLSYDGINLAAGESWEFSQEVEAVTFQNVGEIKYYLVSAQTDSRENNYRNDSATVYSEPIASTGILLDQTTMIMTEKTSGSIHAEVLPKNATFQNAVYTSSDNRVVVVDPMGNVYAVGKGEAVITAYSLDCGQSAECEVTVEGSEEVKYTLSKRKLELEIGSENSLCVSDDNGDSVEGVSWFSTDENIVTIAQDGSIMATGEGIAYLVAKADSFVDVCIVRVSDHSILQLACEESFLQLTVGETAQLEIEIIPKDTTMEKTLTYASDDETVATVNASGFITAVAEGSTVVTVSSINGVQKKISVAVNAPVTYTVAFDTMGGTRVESVEVAADKIVTEEGEAYIGYLSWIPDTYKEGYSFGGWYTSKNGAGEMLGTNTPILDNVTYYAKWQFGGYDDDYDGVFPEDIPEGGIPANVIKIRKYTIIEQI